ncbi:MAG: hypothetical protein AAB729_05625 [Patescibacteria group bacterium]
MNRMPKYYPESDSHSPETPENAKRFHPLLEEVLTELENEEREYFAVKKNFRELYNRELEILSTNIEILLGEYGKSRMKYFEGQEGKQAGSKQALQDYLKLGIRRTIEVDKSYKNLNGDYSTFPEFIRTKTIQLVRQGYFAFLERAVVEKNMDKGIKEAYDQDFFPDNWECRIFVSKDFGIEKAASLLQQPDFPSDTARLEYARLDAGRITYFPLNSNDLKEFNKVKFSPRIRDMSIHEVADT